MAQSEAPKGPYRLVTVNTAPERAKRLIGRVAEDLKDRYEIQHIANCEKIEEVEAAVTKHQPELLFCASMWDSEQAAEIQTIARKVKPGIATYAIPHGLQVERGPDAIVEHLDSMVPQILKLHYGQ
ncbi:hypothetical protein Slin15195_G084040 [Septoria linicola]|uniref:Uncharacterized protein n=1 Tax=Septoria linicola TaxID=215465 RepID=A0A9Q9ATY0_9PEZI|nr:hypothetical protein Slin14017_G086570 [Septoria linicola]USW55085.1 hypothetical protein Slin15195_G084040 [Septoria linicola]